MTIISHNVEVPFPQAFASPPKKRSPFPSAPRYGRASFSVHLLVKQGDKSKPHQADRPPTVRWECALNRGSTLSIRPRYTCTSCYARAFTHGNDVPWNPAKHS